MNIKAATPMSTQMNVLNQEGYAGDRINFDFLDSQGNLTTGVAPPESLQNSVSEKMVSLSDQGDGWYAFGISLADDYHSATIILQKNEGGNNFYLVDQNSSQKLSGEGLDNVITNYVKKVDKRVDVKTTVSIWQYYNKNAVPEKIKPKGLDDL
jgi:hypothetical protein